MKRALIVLLPCLVFAGCTVTAPTPTTAPSIYQNGAQGMDNFATDLQSAQKIEISLHAGGAIPDATHSSIQTAFNTIAGYGIQIDALITAQASATTITAKINAAISSLAGVTLTATNLDAATAAQVNSSIAALQALLTNLLPIFASSVSLATPNPIPMEVAFGPRNNRNTRRRGGRAGAADLQPGAGRAARAERNDYAEAYSYAARRC